MEQLRRHFARIDLDQLLLIVTAKPLRIISTNIYHGHLSASLFLDVGIYSDTCKFPFFLSIQVFLIVNLKARCPHGKFIVSIKKLCQSCGPHRGLKVQMRKIQIPELRSLHQTMATQVRCTCEKPCVIAPDEYH